LGKIDVSNAANKVFLNYFELTIVNLIRNIFSKNL
jgi:hypothetical protein